MAVLNARIESLAYYPVKGCHRIECPALDLVPSGVRGDREWMIVGPGDQFVSQRTDAVLATIVPVPGDDALTLSAPGRPPLQVPLTLRGERRIVRIWKDTCAADDMGDAAAAWLTAVAGRPLRLVRFAADGERHADRAWARDDFAPVKFTDAYPVLITQTASLGALNAALGAASEGPLPMNRFRPNVVLGGLAAWDEDRIERVRIGGALLRLAKPSTRCIVTTTNQDSGARGVEPLPTLKRLRWNGGLKGVTFGVNATVLQPGTVRVGDVAEIAWREFTA